MEDALREGLVTVLKVAKDNPILIEKRNDQLYVGTYTEYHKIIYQTSIKNDKSDFKAVIPASIAKNVPDMILGDVLIEDSCITFVSDSNKTKISLVEDSINLVNLARGYEKENNAEFNTTELKEAFFYTKHASNDKTIGDLVMRGFHFTLKNSECEVMASNGATLSLVKLFQTNIDFSKETVLLVNPEFFNAIKVLEGEFTKVGFNENSVSLTSTTDNYTLRIISSLVNGNSLPYENVVLSAQQNSQVSYVISRRSFLEAVKQVKVFSEKSVLLKFFNTGEFEVESESSSGSATRSIEVKSYENELDKNFNLKVNVEMLFSYLLSTKQEFISVSIKDNESPILFDDNFGINILATLRQ